MIYLPGILFLFLTSAVIATPVSMHVQNRPRAILLSVCLSTVILKTWAYFAIGGVDLGFLLAQIVIGFLAAVAVDLGLAAIRKRTHV